MPSPCSTKRCAALPLRHVAVPSQRPARRCEALPLLLIATPLPLQVSAFPRLAAAYQCQSVHGPRAPMLCRRVATLGVASPMRIVAGRGESLPTLLCASRCLCRATPHRAIAMRRQTLLRHRAANRSRSELCPCHAMPHNALATRNESERAIALAAPLLAQAMQFRAMPPRGIALPSPRSLSPHCSAMPMLRLAQPRQRKSSLCLSNAKLLSASAVCGCSHLCLRPSALFPASAERRPATAKPSVTMP